MPCLGWHRLLPALAVCGEDLEDLLEAEVHDPIDDPVGSSTVLLSHHCSLASGNASGSVSPCVPCACSRPKALHECEEEACAVGCLAGPGPSRSLRFTVRIVAHERCAIHEHKRLGGTNGTRASRFTACLGGCAHLHGLGWSFLRQEREVCRLGVASSGLAPL